MTVDTVLGRYHDSTRIHDTAQSQVPVPGIIEIIVSWPYDYDSTKIHNRLSRPSIMYVTRGEGVKKFKIFMDVIDGSPLTLC